MDVQQLAEGLWRWTTFHPEWKQVVGCVYHEAADAVVLIDPLVPDDEADRFWKALDRDVKKVGKPVHVVVTVFWHTRSSREIAKRYGAAVWAPTRGRAAIERRAGAVTDTYGPGDSLPGGVVPYATARAAEVVFWIPKHRAVVPGDVILGADAGRLRLCPQSWLPENVGQAKLRDSLRPLLELRAQRVIVSHGEPVLARGHAALQRILDVRAGYSSGSRPAENFAHGPDSSSTSCTSESGSSRSRSISLRSSPGSSRSSGLTA